MKFTNSGISLGLLLILINFHLPLNGYASDSEGGLIISSNSIPAKLSRPDVGRLLVFFDAIINGDRDLLMQFTPPRSREESNGQKASVEKSVSDLIQSLEKVQGIVSYDLAFIKEPNQQDDELLVFAYYYAIREGGGDILP